jgi:hypothetical protein
VLRQRARARARAYLCARARAVRQSAAAVLAPIGDDESKKSVALLLTELLRACARIRARFDVFTVKKPHIFPQGVAQIFAHLRKHCSFVEPNEDVQVEKRWPLFRLKNIHLPSCNRSKSLDASNPNHSRPADRGSGGELCSYRGEDCRY